MIKIHPDFLNEQEYINEAYSILERAHDEAKKLHKMVESGRGGTHQARFEKDVISDQVNKRLSQLEIGDASLVFGRIDQKNEEHENETFYIGRIAVWNEKQDPITVDWRAPISESFYRATGRHDMGLTRRRHFASRGKKLLGIEDEFFGDDIIDDSATPLTFEFDITTELTIAPFTDAPLKTIDFSTCPLTEAELLIKEPSGRTSPSGIGKGRTSLPEIKAI